MYVYVYCVCVCMRESGRKKACFLLIVKHISWGKRGIVCYFYHIVLLLLLLLLILIGLLGFGYFAVIGCKKL